MTPTVNAALAERAVLQARLSMLRARASRLPPHAQRHIATTYVRLVSIIDGMLSMPADNGLSVRGLAILDEDDADDLREMMHSAVNALESLTDAWDCDGLVHVLYEGHPLCGAHPGKLPCDWPHGERWVSLGHPGEATCPGCGDILHRRANAS